MTSNRLHGHPQAPHWRGIPSPFPPVGVRLLPPRLTEAERNRMWPTWMYLSQVHTHRAHGPSVAAKGGLQK